jgi:RNase P/RNase MRP subunit POP5
MKPLLPSLREKKRYVVFDIKTDDFDKKKIENIIAETALKFMGEFGISKAGFMILSDSWNGKKGIIKINSKYVDEIKMVLGLIKGNIIVNTVGVSGTLKRSKQKFMEKEE